LDGNTVFDNRHTAFDSRITWYSSYELAFARRRWRFEGGVYCLACGGEHDDVDEAASVRSDGRRIRAAGCGSGEVTVGALEQGGD